MGIVLFSIILCAVSLIDGFKMPMDEGGYAIFCIEVISFMVTWMTLNFWLINRGTPRVKKGVSAFFLFLFLEVFTIAPGLQFLNRVLDRSLANEVTVPVHEIRYIPPSGAGKNSTGPSYHAFVTDWKSSQNETRRVRISRKTYGYLEDHQKCSLRLQLRNGAFGFEWIEHMEVIR